MPDGNGQASRDYSERCCSALQGKNAVPAAVLVWLLVLSGMVLAFWQSASVEAGADLTRNTVRLALACYGIAAVLMLGGRGEWLEDTGRARLARGCWTLGWLAYVLHVVMAFHFFHGWSHAAAVEHTARVGGFGAGIWFNHLFTLLWTADVAWWWLAPRSHAARPAWAGIALHAYLAFIVFQATVVFAGGLVRWLGVGLFAVLGMAVGRRLLRRQ